MKFTNQFRNGAKIIRRISYADFAALSRQKAAQYSIAGQAAVLIDREKDIWQRVQIDDKAPSKIPSVNQEA
jgi:hypothetical protein